jgi:hypothetical protein
MDQAKEWAAAVAVAPAVLVFFSVQLYACARRE